MSTVLRGRIITPGGVRQGCLVLKDGRIEAIRSVHDEITHDYGDALISPGFIDIHTHGLGTGDITTVGGLLEAAKLEPRFGTVGFVPTAATLSEERYHAFARAVAEARKRAESEHARILGCQFEGPFINPLRKGGMEASCLRTMDPGECERYLEGASEILKIVSLSPELDGSAPVIRRLREAGVVVSLGHTLAEPEALDRAAQNGASLVTHLFNTFLRGAKLIDGKIGYPPDTGQWAPSLADYILVDERFACEVICDLVHVHPVFVKIASRCLGADRFVAITDSMTGTGLPPGEHAMMDGRRYSTESGVARLVGAREGDIVGSVLTLDRAFGNLLACGIDPVRAAKYTSTNPARVLGLLEECGTIEPGKRADLVVLDRRSNVLATFLNGEIVHEARPE